jgi:hypothetical protein
VLGNRHIPGREAHIAFLPLTEIAKYAILGPAISIPVSHPTIAGECEYDRETSRRGNAALLLTAKPSVYVLSAGVNPPDFKARCCH